jgi:hypothetical protein
MKILKIKEHKNGASTISYSLTKKEKDLIKAILKVKTLTTKIINQFILQALTKTVIGGK